MRKSSRVLILAMGLSVVAASVGAVPARAEILVDNLGDWMATVGKKDVERQAILTERKAKREAAWAQKKAQHEAKKASKEMDRAGKNHKKGIQGLGN